MSGIKHFIVVNTISPGAYEALKEAFPDANISNAVAGESSCPGDLSTLSRKLTEDEVALMQEADILVVHPAFLSKVMYDLPKTKWVQLTSTGINILLRARREDTPLPAYAVTRNFSKEVGVIMAEYVVGQIICHERSWHSSMANQQRNDFDRGNKFSQFRSLSQLTIGILGTGAMGLDIAGALKYFKCQVHGYSRRPKEASERSPLFDDYWHHSQLPDFLSTCDYVVSVLPSTPETRGLLGKDVLRHAKKSPVLINIGRGDLISESDILHALDSGWISAAILDVFEKEPLPKESALWNHPKVVITPHVSGFGNAEIRNKALIDCFSRNYERFINGQPLLGRLDWESGY
ncbi:glyoxylate/hydroxypyruvate reductase A-like [Macrobrachium nipponense]|uniref:glyoxylate/hydroxypyruvate reductase A-like n=1 Tax=Macrobrachium nipponense TaxID=159736 RepID=UPI0030C8BBCE